MFKILKDKTICLTRGDVANIEVTARLQDGQAYTFSKGDVVRFAVFKRRDCACVELQKDVVADSDVDVLTVQLVKYDTKIGEPVNKPTDYWYEIVLNPDTEPQTIVGYDDEGEKIFRLYPEGSGDE